VSGIRLLDHRSPPAALNDENSRASPETSLKIARMFAMATRMGERVKQLRLYRNASTLTNDER
jgi:hypothetical protein